MIHSFRILQEPKDSIYEEIQPLEIHLIKVARKILEKPENKIVVDKFL